MCFNLNMLSLEGLQDIQEAADVCIRGVILVYLIVNERI